MYYADDTIYAPDEYYPEIVACQDCVPMVDPIWEEAGENVKRYESLQNYIMKRIEQDLEQEHLAQTKEDMDNYQPPEYH